MARSLTITIAALAGALFAFAAPVALAAGNGQTPPKLAKKLNKPVPADLIATLKKASTAGLALGTTVHSPKLKAVNGPRLDGIKNKVGLLYMGADFCPYCAGQRWGLILTLLRFGKFEGLEYMLSSPTDVYANTPTFSFNKATYTSDYVALQAVETADRNGGRLMTPTKQQNQITTKYDAPPYAQVFGAIPFIYLDGQYILNYPMVLPTELTGMDWEKAANTLANPQSPMFQKAMPKVNMLTAAICRLDGGDPDAVCSAPGVIAANGALLRLPAANANGS
ncbi:MAG: DUF929 family protein [Gammaproteobacteria bacterium]